MCLVEILDVAMVSRVIGDPLKEWKGLKFLKKLCSIPT
jgi:hypothetical protein